MSYYSSLIISAENDSNGISTVKLTINQLCVENSNQQFNIWFCGVIYKIGLLRSPVFKTD